MIEIIVIYLYTLKSPKFNSSSIPHTWLIYALINLIYATPKKPYVPSEYGRFPSTRIVSKISLLSTIFLTTPKSKLQELGLFV